MSKEVLLEFNDKIRVVRLDERNLQIQEFRPHKTKKKGVFVTKWSNDDCFYGSMRGALWCISNKKVLRSATIKSIKDVVDKIDYLNKKLDIVDTPNLKELKLAYDKIDSLELTIKRIKDKEKKKSVKISI